MKPSILITGGAGYIGSHTAYLMAQSGYNVIILDSLNHKQNFDCTKNMSIKSDCESTQTCNHKQNLNHEWATLIKSDFADTQTLKNIFENYDIKAVMHFAAFIEVGESVKNPLKFYENNVVKTIKLLQLMLEYNVKNFIFSSSCAVYGNPQYLPLTEDHPKNPISPYGKNKLIVEMALQDFYSAYDLKHVNLRYFNAAGAMPQYGLGEQHDPETHLIPLIFNAMHENKEFYIFGDNYNTKDGSCVRDYIHVLDLAHAHKLALEYLINGNKSDSFNLGTGAGFSVIDIIKSVEKICGTKIKTEYKSKRTGDPATLVADPTKARNILGWNAKHSNLEFIIKTAYEYEKIKRAINYSQIKSDTNTQKFMGA